MYIMAKVSVLPQQQCIPREGQLIALYRIFWYLKCEIPRGNNPNVGILVYDTHKTELDERLFPQSSKYQWNGFYPDAEYLLRPKMPKQISCSMKIRTYVDADNSGNLKIWGYHTGI